MRRRSPPSIGASDAGSAVIELVLTIRSECFKHLLALCLAQAPKVKLVVIPQEDAPLTAGGTAFGLIHGLDERTRIGRGERVEQILVDLKLNIMCMRSPSCQNTACQFAATRWPPRE